MKYHILSDKRLRNALPWKTPFFKKKLLYQRPRVEWTFTRNIVVGTYLTRKEFNKVSTQKAIEEKKNYIYNLEILKN